MNSTQTDELSQQTLVWTRLLQTLASYKYLILATFLATVLSAYGALQLMTEQYESSASILVKLGRENLEPPTAVQKGGIYTSGVRLEEINSEIQMLKSHALIEATVDAVGTDAFKSELAPPHGLIGTLKYHVKKTVRAAKKMLETALITLDLKKDLSDREKVVLEIQDSLVAEREKDSDVIGVNLRLPDPGLGNRVLKVLLDFYLARHIEVHRTAEIAGIFDTQTLAFRERLERLDKEKEGLRRQWNIAAIGEQRNLLLKRLHDIYADLDGIRGETALLRKRHGALSEPVGGRVEGRIITSAKALDPVRKRLSTLQYERVNLLRRYDEAAQPVVDVDQEIAGLELLVSNSLNARQRELQTRADAIEQELNRLNEGESRLEAVERERMIATESFVTYAKRREEAHIAHELDLSAISNVAVLSEPASSPKPVSPKKLVIMGVSLPLGLVLGVALALLLDYLGNVVRSEYDLADIPDMEYLGTFKRPRGK